MYITKIPNRGSPPAVLLRQGYREGGKVKTRTLANLTHWPEDKVEALRRILKAPVGQAMDLFAPEAASFPGLDQALQVVRSRPHGHVAAVVGTMRRLGLAELIDPAPSRRRNLALALIAARLLRPGSKLALARGLDPATLTSTLAEVLEVGGADADDLYQAMDYLLARQGGIEQQLARRHLQEATLVLYDVSSAAFEGSTCPLARLGYPRDGVAGRLQIVYGVLTNLEGCPVAVEVFEGNTADPATLGTQITKLRQRFGLTQVVMVGDRGMITKARIDQQLAESGLGWITALRAPSIKALVAQQVIQPSLFDQTNLAEVSSPAYPGERLVVCRNPWLAAERARKRDELLAATEAELARVQQAVNRPRRPLRGKDRIGVRVGRVIGRYKVGKHFELSIGDDSFSFARKPAAIATEAALDGIYVVRTNVEADQMSASEVVSSYKRLSKVERAFRIFNNDLDVRPIRHFRSGRVRAHLLVCMLAHYLEWHMLEDLAPMLFQDDDPVAAEQQRTSPVDKAVRSPGARAKAARKVDSQGQPVHSFESLLADLATLAANRIRPTDSNLAEFDLITIPTPVQQRAFKLLGVSHRTGLP